MVEEGDSIVAEAVFPWLAPGASEPIPMSAFEWFTFREGRSGTSCSRRKSPLLPAQPGSAMTGLSRRMSRPVAPVLETRACGDLPIGVTLARFRDEAWMGP
jgi:hypothetical protein